jgi:hypothetical protein
VSHDLHPVGSQHVAPGRPQSMGQPNLQPFGQAATKGLGQHAEIHDDQTQNTVRGQQQGESPVTGPGHDERERERKRF